MKTARRSLPDLPPLDQLRAFLVESVEEAGHLALRDFRRHGRTLADIQSKEGGSPVTSADIAVDRLLGRRLLEAFPIGYHSEERPESWRHAEEMSFVVDPIDGTRNFIDGGDAWCIVVGVLAAGVPIAGAVHMPARSETYSAFRGGGAFRNDARLSTARLPEAPYRTTGPRPIAERLGQKLGLDLPHVGAVPALAHRVLTPLGQTVDLAVANAGGHDWDIVASDCILAEAGGTLMSLEGQRPVYRLDGGAHPPLVAGATALFEKIGAGLLTNPA